MKNPEFVNKLTRSVNRFGMKLKKHSPEILVVTGVVGVVASTVMACKATTKLSGILEESKENLDQIHNYIENEGFSEKYTEEDSKKDLAIVYAHTAWNLTKLYAPSVVMGAASIACILTSHKIMHSRNAALAVAFAASEKGFKEYRGRLVERFGEKLDQELLYNIKAKEIEETVVNEETGEETVVKKVVEVAAPGDASIYARFFDEFCVNWDRDAEYNLMFLKQIQEAANNKLRAQGHMSLNEVYEMIGLDKTKAGAFAGWIYNPKNQVGDDYISFGIYDVRDEQKRLFVNGHEKSVLLDFNCIGNYAEYI